MLWNVTCGKYNITKLQILNLNFVERDLRRGVARRRTNHTRYGYTPAVHRNMALQLLADASGGRDTCTVSRSTNAQMRTSGTARPPGMDSIFQFQKKRDDSPAAAA
jgi:hypothetical protein